MRLRSIGITAATAALIALGVTAAPAQAGTGEEWGCPLGYVCMYDNVVNWINEDPDHKWYRYGYYALSGEYGLHWVVNNQYATPAGRPGAYACEAKTPSRCNFLIPMGKVRYFKADPINYIRLTPSGG
jgi:hypothetical protein